MRIEIRFETKKFSTATPMQNFDSTSGSTTFNFLRWFHYSRSASLRPVAPMFFICIYLVLAVPIWLLTQCGKVGLLYSTPICFSKYLQKNPKGGPPKPGAAPVQGRPGQPVPSGAPAPPAEAPKEKTCESKKDEEKKAEEAKVRSRSMFLA